MEKQFKAVLTDKGFSKLSYYIEEEIITEFTNSLNKYSPIDAWLYAILGEISANSWIYNNPDFENLYNDIYLEICSELDTPAVFKKTTNYISNEKFIQWEEIEAKI